MDNAAVSYIPSEFNNKDHFFTSLIRNNKKSDFEARGAPKGAQGTVKSINFYALL